MSGRKRRALPAAVLFGLLSLTAPLGLASAPAASAAPTVAGTTTQEVHLTYVNNGSKVGSFDGTLTSTTNHYTLDGALTGHPCLCGGG